MEIIPIGNSKIKISLTYDDLEKYSLTCEDLDYDTTEVRRAFWAILDDAKRSSGFDAAKSKIMVQLFTCSDGGCEMFITRMPHIAHDDVICIKDPISHISTRAFAFESFENLSKACALLRRMDYKFESRAYKGDGCYYLTVDCPEDTSAHDHRDISYPDLLCEFARPIEHPHAAEYISEHFKILCPSDAIANLA